MHKIKPSLIISKLKRKLQTLSQKYQTKSTIEKENFRLHEMLYHYSTAQSLVKSKKQLNLLQLKILKGIHNDQQI